MPVLFASVLLQRSVGVLAEMRLQLSSARSFCKRPAVTFGGWLGTGVEGTEAPVTSKHPRATGSRRESTQRKDCLQLDET